MGGAPRLGPGLRSGWAARPALPRARGAPRPPAGLAAHEPAPPCASLRRCFAVAPGLCGGRAARAVSAWGRRFAKPAAGWLAWRGARTTPTRSRHATSLSGAPQVRSISEPSAARTSCPRSLVRPRRPPSPASPVLTPGVIHASMASAVAPGPGHGAKEPSRCLAREARGANARLVPAPTNNRPVVGHPVRRRAMLGRYKPSSARSPAPTAVARGLPQGANDPIITLRWGRVGSSLL